MAAVVGRAYHILRASHGSDISRRPSFGRTRRVRKHYQRRLWRTYRARHICCRTQHAHDSHFYIRQCIFCQFFWQFRTGATEAFRTANQIPGYFRHARPGRDPSCRRFRNSLRGGQEFCGLGRLRRASWRGHGNILCRCSYHWRVYVCNIMQHFRLLGISPDIRRQLDLLFNLLAGLPNRLCSVCCGLWRDI